MLRRIKNDLVISVIFSNTLVEYRALMTTEPTQHHIATVESYTNSIDQLMDDVLDMGNRSDPDFGQALYRLGAELKVAPIHLMLRDIDHAAADGPFRTHSSPLIGHRKCYHLAGVFQSQFRVLTAAAGMYTLLTGKPIDHLLGMVPLVEKAATELHWFADVDLKWIEGPGLKASEAGNVARLVAMVLTKCDMVPTWVYVATRAPTPIAMGGFKAGIHIYAPAVVVTQATAAYIGRALKEAWTASPPIDREGLDHSGAVDLAVYSNGSLGTLMGPMTHKPGTSPYR